MANVFTNADAWLAGQLAAHAGVSVEYIRGDSSVRLNATVGSTTFEQADADGATTVFRSRDFIIAAASLVLDGVPIEPIRGDEIRENDGYRTYRNHAVGGNGQAPWRWGDGTRQTVRIHTTESTHEGQL